MIEGIILRELRVIPDERGCLMEVFRCDDPEFRKFGQVYITTNYPGVVKAWHYHELQWDNVACVKGMIKLVLYDGRSGSATQGEVNEFFIGEHNPALIVIPPNVFHGWKCVSESESIVVNIPSEKYDYDNPDEHRLPFDTDEIPYNWDIVMK